MPTQIHCNREHLTEETKVIQMSRKKKKTVQRVSDGIVNSLHWIMFTEKTPELFEGVN